MRLLTHTVESQNATLLKAGFGEKTSRAVETAAHEHGSIRS